jgi:acyl-CoA synthetase (AMP-forming)/AMP-acid ligase II/thioesterase domain-containing protein/NAD(P)-dependent dehydrogenase (short-subunit alcohol dehydrogenase family)/acyl carrier protein
MADSSIITADVITDQLAKYSPEKLRLLARRLAKQKSEPRRELIRRSEPGCNSFPLSYAQEGFWFLEQLTPANPALIWRFAFRMHFPIQAQTWKQAFKELATRHAILRTHYEIRDGAPVQVVESELELPVEILDFSHLPLQHKEEAVTHVLKNDNQGFHVDCGPLWRIKLMRLSGDCWVLAGAIHHSIVDAWSRTVFVRELATLTASLGSSQPLHMPELPIQYGDYASWQRGWLNHKTVPDLVAWWKQQLQGISDSHLPLDHPRPPAQRFRQAAETVLIPKHLGDRVRELSQRAGVTPFMAYFTAFKTLLMRYSGQTDIAVIVPSANRERIELEGLIGLFVNTLVVRTDLAMQPTFRELLGRVHRSMVDALSHQDLPFEMLVRELRLKRELDRNPLCQVSFQLEDIPQNTAGAQAKQPAIVPIEVETGASVYDLNLHLFEDWDSHMIERPEGTRAVMFYDPDLFDGETIRRMLDCYVVLLNSAVSNPDACASELSMITELDRHRYCGEWNETRKQYTKTSLSEWFEELAQSEPNHVAVVSATRTLTRGDLNHAANCLAHHLRLVGVGTDCPVAVAASGVDAIISILAIWKAGGCVVALGTEDTSSQWNATLQLTKAPLTITQSAWKNRFETYTGRVAVLDEDWEGIARHSTANPRREGTAQSLAYIIHAGRKAILVEHQSACHRVEWLQTQHKLAPGDGVLQGSSLATDGGIQEMLWGLVGGGRLVMAGNDTDFESLDGLIRNNNIRVAHLTEEKIAELVALPAGAALQANLPLRCLFCSSDRPRSSVLQAAANRLGCSVCHIYAPPEATTPAAITYYSPGEPAAETRTQRTGNMSIYVLEPSLQPAPPGVRGEIYLAAINMARGYLEASAELQCFPASPFCPEERFFRTGDFARTFSDGSLQLLGSGPEHTFRHGHRLEPVDVAIALQQEPAVVDCTVLVRESETATRLLVAYVVSDGIWSSERLRAHLESMLPGWMVPDFFVRVSRIPLLPTGELDQKSLEAVELIDETVAKSWEEHLLAEPEVQHAGVVIREEREEMGRLRLEDLLKSSGMSAATVTVPRRSSAASTALLDRKHASNPATTAALSIAEGGPLPETSFRVLPELLEQASRRAPAADITYLQTDGSEISCSYAQLLNEAQCILGGLRKRGLQPGSPVIFQLSHNNDFVAALWGCVLGGYIPVPVSIAPTYKNANAVTAKLVHASEMLDRALVISAEPLARLVADSARLHGAEPLPVVTIQELRQSAPDCNLHHADPDDVVLMLLTSGSTGKPKAVQLSHRNLISMSAAVAQMNNFSGKDVSLNWMPLDHVGGIVMFHVRDVLLGCRQLHAYTNTVLQNPLRWLDWIDQYRVSITWAPNFAFGLINDQAGEIARRHWDLSSLRFILNGGEAVVAKTARTFLKLLEPFGLPGSAMHPSWGMSETSSGVVFSKRFRLETTNDEAQFVEVGTPVAGTAVRVVDAQNQVVGESETGRLQIKGATVTSGYYLRPDLNREAFQDGGWFETGDLAYMRGGQLTIAGRLKDVIIVNGVNYHCHEIESVVEDVEGVEVSYTAAFSTRRAGSNTDEVVILFNAENPQAVAGVIQNIRAKVAQKIGVQPDYVIPVAKEVIPKTAIGKIQRSELKQQFEAGEFDSIVRQFEHKSEITATLPDWFYRPAWCRREIGASGPLSLGTWVVFRDAGGLGDALSENLSMQGRNCVSVEPGSEFLKLGPGRYTIDPNCPEQYRSLLETLRREQVQVSEIVHLWTHREYEGEITDRETLRDRLGSGVYSLLFLAKALTDEIRTPARLTVVSSYTQNMNGRASIAPERAAILGLLKTMGKELPSLTCRHIDLPMAGHNGDLAELILSEARASQGEAEVAYTGNQRLVSRLEQVQFTPAGKAEPPLRAGDGYLVAGGLGGLGAAVARYLLRETSARLLLVGRSPLPDRIAWDEIKRHDTPLAERIRTYEELEQLGEVMYEAVDICDEEGLRRAVSKAESCWSSSLAGVIHCAGVLRDCLLRDETKEGLADVLLPKLYGASVLHRIAKERAGSLFVSFSSVNAFFGGTGMGAYAAANSALEAFAGFQRASCEHLRSHCVSWSMWSETGMSRGYAGKQVSRTQGFASITPQQGIDSLLLALHYRLQHVLIGLDAGSLAIQRYLTAGSPQARQLYGYFEAPDSNLRDRLYPLQVHDRLGKATVCRLQRLERLPLTESGEVDRQQLRAAGSLMSDQDRRHVAPRNQDEREIAAIWGEVLGVRDVGINDDFFASGGSSMSAVQLMARIRKHFDRDLPLSILFEGPSVAHLASAMRQPNGPAQSPLVPIQPGGTKRPMFMVHPAGGNVLCYHELAHQLGNDQPFYGLEEPGTRTGGLEYLTVEQMAARYCEALRRVQPEGPYHVGGWSMGGVVAFEMAWQLKARGHTVDLLVIFDVEAPVGAKTAAEETDATQALMSISKLLEIYVGRALSIKESEIAARAGDEQIDYLYRCIKDQGLLPPEIDSAYFRRYLQVHENNVRAMRNYSPREYAGRITLFRSQEMVSGVDVGVYNFDDPTLGWQQHSPQSIPVHVIPGNHITMMSQPNVVRVAELLTACLSGAQSDSQHLQPVPINKEPRAVSTGGVQQ